MKIFYKIKRTGQIVVIRLASNMSGRGGEGSGERSLIKFDFSMPSTSGQQLANRNAPVMKEVREERERNQASQDVLFDEGL